MSTQPSEVLRPSPLDLGGVITGTFRIFKQRLGAFAFLAFLPSILAVILVMGAMAPLIYGIMVSVARSSFSGWIVLGIVLLFAAVVVGSLAQIKVQAMMVLGAHDVIHGQPSDNRELHARTKGVVGRVLLLYLAVCAAVFLVFGLLMGGMIAAIVGAIATSSDRDPTGAIATVIISYLVFLLLIWVLSLFMFYLQVRFLYLLPALAVEQRPVVDALKRSWGLTRGNVLRTLGYFLVGSMLAGLASFAVQMISQIFSVPLTSRSSSSYNSGFDLIPVLAVMGITLGLQIVVQVLAVPFLAIYQTVMYVDQLRRNSLPPGYARGGYPASPAQRPGAYAPQAPFPPQPQSWQPQSPKPQSPQQWQPPGGAPGQFGGQPPTPGQGQQWGGARGQQWGSGQGQQWGNGGAEGPSGPGGKSDWH